MVTTLERGLLTWRSVKGVTELESAQGAKAAAEKASPKDALSAAEQVTAPLVRAKAECECRLTVRVSVAD